LKKSTFLGSVVSVLLAFSVISDARTYIQQQDPKSVQPTNQTTNVQSNTPTELTKSETTATEPNASAATAPVSETGTNAGVSRSTEKPPAVIVPAESYTATAYSLRGRTASGKPVARGVIAADPRFLPIGTRVRVDAGAWSGEYIVADTGGSVRGRRIDIWTPTAHEAMRFGRRFVKLTVLELGAKRSRTKTVPARVLNPAPVQPATDAQNKQEE